MARTFWGNILETLAATGMNTAANIGMKAILSPMAGRQEASQQVLKSLLPAMGSETDPGKLSAIASKIKDISGVDLATGTPETNPAGYEGRMGGAELTVPKSTSLESLAPGVSITPGFIKPIPSLDMLKAGIINRLPIEKQQDLLTKDPERELKQLQVLSTIGDKDAQRRLQELAITQRGDIARQHNETMQAMQQSNQELRKVGLQQTLQNQQVGHGLIKDRLEAGAMSQLQKSLDAVNKVVKDPMSTEGTIKTAMENYNATHANIVKKYPDLADSFKPLDPELSTGWLGTSVGSGKVVGVKPRESGTAAATVKSPTIVWPQRAMVNGKETIINSQEEYNKLMGK